ncbi:hypothetical protein O1M54_44360 [Streptomyces diastatochromogenes]|nr:hypothetical protein [Streptomyces diastatochromogenes]
MGAALAAGDVDQAVRWAAQAMREADRLHLDGQRAAALRAEASLVERHGDTGTAVRLSKRPQRNTSAAARPCGRHTPAPGGALAQRIGQGRAPP